MTTDRAAILCFQNEDVGNGAHAHPLAQVLEEQGAGRTLLGHRHKCAVAHLFPDAHSTVAEPAGAEMWGARHAGAVPDHSEIWCRTLKSPAAP
jgi:hypothetical protein